MIRPSELAAVEVHACSVDEPTPAYLCTYSEDHASGEPCPLEFQGWHGAPRFRRYLCPECGTSYPESSLKGRPGRDPKAVAA